MRNGIHFVYHILQTTMGKLNMKIGRLKAGSRQSSSSEAANQNTKDNKGLE